MEQRREMATITWLVVVVAVLVAELQNLPSAAAAGCQAAPLFSVGQQITLPGRLLAVATNDFDGNGLDDLVILADEGVSGGKLYQLINVGNGTFAIVSVTTVTTFPRQPLALTVGFFNDDL